MRRWWVVGAVVLLVAAGVGAWVWFSGTDESVSVTADSTTADRAADRRPGPPQDMRPRWHAASHAAEVVDGTVITSRKTGVVALDASSGKEVWHYLADSPVTGVAIDRSTGTVVVPVGDVAVLLDAATGKERATVQFPKVTVEANWQPVPFNRVGEDPTTLIATDGFTAFTIPRSGGATVRLDTARKSFQVLDHPEVGCAQNVVGSGQVHYFISSGCPHWLVAAYRGDRLVGDTDLGSISQFDCPSPCGLAAAAGTEKGIVLSAAGGTAHVSLTVGRDSTKVNWTDQTLSAADLVPVNGNRVVLGYVVRDVVSGTVLGTTETQLRQSWSVAADGRRYFGHGTVAVIDLETLNLAGDEVDFKCTVSGLSIDGRYGVASCDTGLVGFGI